MEILSQLPVDAQGLLELDQICIHHVQRLGRYLGLKGNGTRDDQRDRIQEYWQARSDVRMFKARESTWFCLDARQPVPNDALGVQQFFALAIEFLHPLTMAIRETVVTELAGPGAWEEWELTGNLCVNGMFSWLWEGITVEGHHEPGVQDLIDMESAVFLHHLRERNGEANRGWSRVMYYSLTQQIIRQDLGYWALCANLCSDGNPRMVSYPYYTKHVVDGDSTFFRHLDINVPRYLELGWGKNAIQGSVSLDDEAPGNCTEIIPGFHHHLKQWWDGVVEEKRDTNGDVHSFTSKVWSVKDEETYGSFQPAPCLRGGVRLTRPEILHGSSKTVLSSVHSLQGGHEIRRTILPWYMGVKEDGLTLDNPHAGTWAELSAAHIQQLQPKLTPSGKPTSNWPISGRFPGTQVLRPEDPVSQALVCQLAWTDPAVEVRANQILGEDRSPAQRLILRSRQKALQMAKEAFPLCVNREQPAYGAFSYFHSGSELG